MNYLGDYCYGTEILELPKPEETIKLDKQTLRPSSYASNFQVHHRASNVSPNARYWFRWITGHQVMLILWSILVSKLRENEGQINEDKLHTCTQILQACSVIFEYTGSCSNDFYHQHVRPCMALFHREFSGLWAADYRPMPRLIRQITKADCPPELEEARQKMIKAYQAHQKAHIGVAQRLVPEGVSLLKKAKKEHGAKMSIKPNHFRLFDFFFLVERKSVPASNLLESLEKRMVEVIRDIKDHPLPHSPINAHPIHTLQEVLEVIKQPQNIYNL